MRHFGTLCLAIIGASILSFPVAAQQKTVKACQEEWRANKADNQAKGITEKAYVAQCRAGGSAASPAPAPASSTSSAAPAGTQKTVKACQAEWRANKANNQANGITEKAYVAQCRAGGSAASPTPAPAASTSSAALAGTQKTVKACQEEWRANKADNQAKGITEKAYVAQCRAGSSAANPAPAPAASTASAVPAGTQKTVKACQEEWRANKADNQAKGITEKAYVAQCRAGSSAANPAPAPAASTSSQSTVAAPAATQKTVKACRDEWRANKADNQAKGITEKAYVESCRAGTTAAQPTPASTTASSPAAAPAPRAAPTPSAAPTATVTPTGANQYATEAQAKLRCGLGTVVWANLDSKIYHFASYKNYGNTKTGAYMCESDATSQGMRAAKNEKHP